MTSGASCGDRLRCHGSSRLLLLPYWGDVGESSLITPEKRASIGLSLSAVRSVHHCREMLPFDLNSKDLSVQFQTIA